MDATKTMMFALVLAGCGASGGGTGDTDPDVADDDDGASDDDDDSDASGDTEASGTDGETDGESDTDGDTDGDTDTDGDPECPGHPIDADGSLDLDLGAVQLALAIALDGGNLPAEPGGAITFTEVTSAASFSLPLAAVAADGSARVVLGPGHYDVAYAPQGVPCDGVSAMPCTGGAMLDDVQLRQDGALDLDIGRVEVALDVTQNGGALPDGPRGSLVFGDEEQLAAAVDLTMPPASITVFPGVHTVRYVGNAAACAGGAESAMPCGGAALMSDVELRQDGSLQLDIPAVAVSGSVTLDGEGMPTSVVDRGRVRFTAPDGASALSEPLGSSGAATYELLLAPGSYEVHYDATPGACDEDPAIPCVGGLAGVQALMQDGTFDVDVPTARIHGDVTLNGSALPSSAVLSFVGESGASATTDPIDDGYGITVMRGEYMIFFEGDPTGCANELPDLPCVRGVLVDDATLTSSGTLDLDIPAVTVTGNVTVQGDALPDAGDSRGSIQFVTEHGLATPAPLGAAGGYDYGIRLIPGRYDVLFTGNPALCQGGDPSVVPCLGGIVRPAADLSSGGTLDIDLPSVEIRGNVTLDGEALPNEAAPRGHIEFASPDGSVSMLTTPFDVGGPVSYAVSLIPASYIVRHAANPELCLVGPTPSVPCAPQVLLGCPSE